MVAIAVVALFVTVFLLGEKQSLFHRKVHLRAAFANTSGLVIGTPVRLAGVDVGVVEKIEFDPDLRVRKVHVLLGVSSIYAPRIRADSVARLTSKGLLGDMVVDIAVGGADAAQLRDGQEIPAQESVGIAEIVRSVQDAIGEVRTLTRTTTSRIDALLSEQVTADVARTMHAFADLSEDAAHGKGVVHALLHDPRLTEDLVAFGASGQRATNSAAHALARIDGLLAQEGVDHIPGDLARTVASLSDVAMQLKEGKGLMHTLLYAPDRTGIVENLAVFSSTLRGVSDEVAAGKGTVGALLKDPTVYQDLKLIFGNVRRSRLLRTLVRYTITHDGLRAGEQPGSAGRGGSRPP